MEPPPPPIEGKVHSKYGETSCYKYIPIGEKLFAKILIWNDTARVSLDRFEKSEEGFYVSTGLQDKHIGKSQNTGAFMTEKEWTGFKLQCSKFLSPKVRQAAMNGQLPFFTPNFDPEIPKPDTNKCLMICRRRDDPERPEQPIAFWIVGTKYTQNLIDRSVNSYQCRMTEAMFQSLLENIPLIDDGIEAVKHFKFATPNANSPIAAAKRNRGWGASPLPPTPPTEEEKEEARRDVLRASGLYAVFLACGKLVGYYGSMDEVSILRFLEKRELNSIPIPDIMQQVTKDSPDIMTQSTLTVQDIHDYMGRFYTPSGCQLMAKKMLLAMEDGDLDWKRVRKEKKKSNDSTEEDGASGGKSMKI